MCTGRVDLELVLQAFARGADGVIIIGCRLNECNYTVGGNYDALNMVLLCKRILEYSGLNPQRLRIEFMSSGEGNRFVEVMLDFSKNVKELGALGKSEGIEENGLQLKLADIIKLVPYIKLAENEKLEAHLENPGDYETLFTLDEIKKLIEEAVSYNIEPAKCQACGICARKCPVDAIKGGRNLVHIIDQEKCVKCATCFESCPPRFAAVRRIISEQVPSPVSESERTITRGIVKEQAD
jgi:F420-non-reducing hydrogenase iron-sulfur subunit